MVGMEDITADTGTDTGDITTATADTMEGTVGMDTVTVGMVDTPGIPGIRVTVDTAGTPGTATVGADGSLRQPTR